MTRRFQVRRAQRPRRPRRLRPVGALCTLLALVVVLLVAPSAPMAAATPAATRAQLKTLRSRIAVMARQSSRDAAERNRLSAELRAAELSLAASRAALQVTDARVEAQDAQRAATAAQRVQQTRTLLAGRALLASELRAAYLLQHEGPLQLLLNQRDVLGSERLMTYYGYLGRAGAARVATVAGELQRLDALDAGLTRQQSALAALREVQQGQLQQLSQARARRQAVLTSLMLRAHTRAQQLAQLESQRQGLQQLLQGLGRSRQKATGAAGAGGAAPEGLPGAFAQLRGGLAWPVNGRVLAQFGQQRAAGVSWDGVLISTGLDTPVHAVAAGRVVYADWLAGLGLLIIVDHGEQYLSLYAHNDRLYKAVGAPVAAGEVIAAAGDSGGRAEPQLLFELRRAGKPIDPRPWFRTAVPAP